MIRLLNANFYRLKKSYSFWIILFITMFLGVFIYINNNGINPNSCLNCDNQYGEIFFNYLFLNWIFIPIFTCTFIGTEYQEGTIKNKIITGHKRINIYFSNLITVIIVTFIYSIIYILLSFLTSLILKYSFTIPTYKFINFLISSILLNISISSLFTFISMSIKNKSTSIVISLALVIWSIIIIPNISYKFELVTGIKKVIYKIILNIIPYGQIYQITNLKDNCNYLWLYSLILIIIVNLYGIFIIKNKEIN